MHAKRTLLTLALVLALLSGSMPAAQAADSLTEEAASAAGGGGELTAHKDLYHQDAEGTVSFENLEQRVRENATTRQQYLPGASRNDPIIPTAGR